MNTLETVVAVLAKLRDFGLETALFGGWAEEARGLRDPGPHSDIDLVIEADNFQPVDGLFASDNIWNEIVQKRFHHKRAFVHTGTMVELCLVEQNRNRSVTHFWGDTEYVWLRPLTTTAFLGDHCVRAVTSENLTTFRQSYKSHQPWRWQVPGSCVKPVLTDKPTNMAEPRTL